MDTYPKPPFETKITVTEDTAPGSEEGPTVTVIDLNEIDNENLELAAASGSELAKKILAFRFTLMLETTKENTMSEIKEYPGLLDVHVYVNPETSEIDGIFAFNFLGLCVRSEGDWEPVLRSETNIDEIASDDIYRLDWSIDDIPVSEATDEDDEEHALLEAFDNDTITLELVQYYCKPIQKSD